MQALSVKRCFFVIVYVIIVRFHIQQSEYWERNSSHGTTLQHGCPMSIVEEGTTSTNKNVPRLSSPAPTATGGGARASPHPSSTFRRRIPVYVYDLPGLFDQARRYSGLGGGVDVWRVFREHNGVIPDAQKRQAGVVTAQTDQWNLWPHLIRSLGRSRRFRPTKDPARAELFLVPLFPYTMSTEKLGAYCEAVSDLGEIQLQHLSVRNAHRHVILLGKSHSSARGRFCDGWWGDTINGGENFCDSDNHPLCAAQRFALTMSYHVVGDEEENRKSSVPGARTLLLEKADQKSRMKWWGKSSRMQPKPACSASPEQEGFCRALPDGRVVAVPYLSSVVEDECAEDGRCPEDPERSPPWQSVRRDRDALVSYSGKPHGLQENLRRYLHTLCEQNSADCLLVTKTADERNFLDAKFRSTFCLEPEGDTPFRKSLFDSFLSGCIPVFFSPATDNMAPAHMGEWRVGARIVLDPSDFGLDFDSTGRGRAVEDSPAGNAGVVQQITPRQDGGVRAKHPDLLSYLRGIGEEEVRRMQVQIAEHAHSLNWGIWDGGAADRLLEYAWQRAEERDRGGHKDPEDPICVSVAASGDQVPGLVQLIRSLAKYSQESRVVVHVWFLEEDAETGRAAVMDRFFSTSDRSGLKKYAATRLSAAEQAALSDQVRKNVVWANNPVPDEHSPIPAPETVAKVRVHFDTFTQTEIQPYQNRHSDRENLKDPHNYIRFILHERLSDSDCLWVDADVLILQDLSSVRDFARPKFQSQHPPPVLAAFPRPGEDPVEKKIRAAYKEAGFVLPGSDYPPDQPAPTSFNAGVLWLNLDVWRAAKLDEKVRGFCRFNEERKLFTWFGSNPPLSLLFGGPRFVQFPTKWMLNNLGWDMHKGGKVGAEVVFAHWNGKRKPWLDNGAYKRLWEGIG